MDRAALYFEKLVNEGKESEVRKLLNYAAWCLSPKSGKLPNDTSTAVVCAFYEDIGKNKKLWPYFKEWFFSHEFSEIKEYFKYHLSEEEFSELENTYHLSE